MVCLILYVVLDLVDIWMNQAILEHKEWIDSLEKCQMNSSRCSEVCVLVVWILQLVELVAKDGHKKWARFLSQDLLLTITN